MLRSTNRLVPKVVGGTSGGESIELVMVCPLPPFLDPLQNRITYVWKSLKLGQYYTNISNCLLEI